jgi:phosphoglycolate phosphatase-like HAD superfamily hydrolase
MEKLRSVKAVLHDWDDVIVATFDPVTDLINNFAIASGLPTHKKESIHKVWGPPMKTFISSLWPLEQDPENLLERYLASVPADFVKPAFPGVQKAIRQLYNSYNLGIVSSGRSNLIIQDLYRIGIPPEFYTLIHGQEECIDHKPNAAVFDNALKELAGLGIHQDKVIYVGDDLSDYVAARGRGLAFLAVTSGFTTYEQFIEQGLDADSILPSFTDVPDFLKR